MGFREKIRALLDADDGDDEDTGSATDEIESDLADALAENDGDTDEGDGIGESGADEESGDEAGSSDEGADEVEGTPGDDEQSAEDAELRAKIIEQAEQIEALRNRLAAAGIEDDVEDVADAVEDEVDDTVDEDVVEAFDTDYAEREARLAEIKEN